MKFSLHNLWEFIKLLKIEIYFFLVFFCLNLQIVTNTQLMEDKLCFNELKYSPEFCLATDASEVFSDQRKYILLEETTSLNNYRTIIEVVPSMFLALFGGYWIDSYPGHLKLILSLPVIAEITKMIILIINCIYFPSNAYLLLTSFPLCAFLGTGYACITGVNTYIAWTTPPKLRFVRFAVVELCLTLVNLLGSLVGGYVLTMKPWFKGQPANYMGVYIIGLTSMVLAQMWLLIMVPSLKMPEEVERKPSSSEVAPTDSHPALAAHAARTSSINGTVASTSTEQPTKSLSFFGKMVDVFNFSTVSKVFKTINKKRPDGGRSMVICLVVSMMLFRAADFGEAGCDFQFSQRAYGWNPRSYSVFYAIFHLPPALVTLVLPPILNRHFKLADTTVGIIACISFFGQYFLRGTILSSSGYFISYTVGSLHRMCPAALRSLLCKLVDPHEMGEIFSIFTAMEAFIRLFESTIYTAVFNASIDEYPGLVFHIMGATGFFIYIVFMWIDLRLRRISREKRQTEISRIAAAFGNCPADQIKPVNSPPDSLNNSTSHLTPPKLPTIDEQGISNPAYGSSLETSTTSMKR